MTLSEIKSLLTTAEAVNFKLPTGAYVPEHFHVTEVGLVTKHFIDCGGTERLERVANFQLWDANDYEHRLKPQKLMNIIGLSEKVLGLEDVAIEVEYQTDTVGKYGLDYDGKDFVLVAKKTACLASDACGIKQDIEEPKKTKSACCAPGGGCC